MAVTRKIDEFPIFAIQNWGANRFFVEVRDPDEGSYASAVMEPSELKAISKEIKAAIKELEGK